MNASLREKRKSSIDSIVKACVDVFGKELRCVVLEGSALRNDFMPYYSDVDIHAYVDSSVLEDDRVPKLEYVTKFQEAIGRLIPRDAGASQFQVYFLPADRKPTRWCPPIVGTYEVLYGAPVPSMEPLALQEHLERQWHYLEEARRFRLDLLGRFVDKPNSSIPAVVRLSGTGVKGLLYALHTVLFKDPKRAISSPLSQILADICDEIPELSCAKDFFGAVRDWSQVERDPKKAREAFVSGIRSLAVIEKWRASHPKPF